MPFEFRTFNLREVRGIGRAALDIHVALYRGYVEQVNTLLAVLQPPVEPPIATSKLMRDAAVRRFAFEYNGVVLHELFFEQLSGANHKPPTDNGPLIEAFGRAFGGFSGWRDDIEKLAATRGVGWVLTVRDRGDGSIYNVWVDEHQLGMTAGTDIIFALDVWEHAYLLDFAPSQRLAYTRMVFANVDWRVVESRCK